MPTQTSFSGRTGASDWGRFYEGLRQGQPSAYLLLIGLAVAATVAIWVGTNVMKKDTSR